MIGVCVNMLSNYGYMYASAMTLCCMREHVSVDQQH